MSHMFSITDNEAASRFETTVEGFLCVLDYRLRNAVLVITHTAVPSAVAGRGIAAELTRIALAKARREGWRVDPRCSYAAAYLDRHPHEQDLLARG